MADIINENGLQLQTLNEIIAALETEMRTIYGVDINLDQNSPDGQLVNIFAQACIDIRELAQMVYNSFDPDKAIGRQLDERVVINNIERQGGSFTQITIAIVVDRTVALQGLDADFNSLSGVGFTVQDNAGNQFILIDSATLTAGTHSKIFRAKEIGLVETTIATIVNQTTIVLGVVSINNPSAAIEIGQAEETDADLRVRRQRSVAIASSGYLNGLLGAVLNLDGVTDAKLYENYTSVIDANDIPAHGTWLIVEGGANTDIAAAYYAKKSFGSDMKGAVAIDIITASGATWIAKFDRPIAKNLHIRFDIQPTIAIPIYDLAAIKTYIVANLSYNIGDFAETSDITTVARAAITASGGGGVAVNVEISANGSNWFDYLVVDTLDEQWVVDTSRITITEL